MQACVFELVIRFQPSFRVCHALLSWRFVLPRLVCPAVNFSLSSTAALSWNKSVGELTYLVIPMASCVTPRGGLAIGRTETIPGGLAANLARYPTFYFFIFLLLFLPAECILK